MLSSAWGRKESGQQVRAERADVNGRWSQRGSMSRNRERQAWRWGSLTSRDVLLAFLQCCHTDYHILLTTSSWKRKTSLSSLERRNLKILSIYLHTQPTVAWNVTQKPAACHVLKCQSCTPERHGRPIKELLRAAARRQYGHPRDGAPERQDSPPWCCDLAHSGTLATPQYFFKQMSEQM